MSADTLVTPDNPNARLSGAPSLAQPGVGGALDVRSELLGQDKFRRRNSYYYAELHRQFKEHVPPGASVLEVGCGPGHLLADLQPSRGVGIESKPRVAHLARSQYPQLNIINARYDQFELDETFDYVLVAGALAETPDVQAVFERIRRVCHDDTRVIVANFNALWEPVLKLGGRIGLRQPVPNQNWLGHGDVRNLLELADLEVVRCYRAILMPKYVPLLTALCNRALVRIWPFKYANLVSFFIVRHKPQRDRSKELTCSVIVPTRNERGNVEEAIRRTPTMGRHTEIIFVDGNSTDGTVEEVNRRIAAHPEKDVSLIHQGDGRGKGDAVRKGFAAAKGDVLMILDADLTVPPEELPKFFTALAQGKADFINGTRLVYPLAPDSMRFLNRLANRFFGALFSWLLGQRYRDTLCGTKVLTKKSYERIAANRTHFGLLDPFGDFDLIFGASRANLKTIELPVRYEARRYGETRISRFRDGWLLLRMSWLAFRKLKLQ